MLFNKVCKQNLGSAKRKTKKRTECFIYVEPLSHYSALRSKQVLYVAILDLGHLNIILRVPPIQLYQLFRLQLLILQIYYRKHSTDVWDHFWISFSTSPLTDVTPSLSKFHGPSLFPYFSHRHRPT